MYKTNYHKAKNIGEAIGLIKNADEGKFLAGGQTLIPTMKQRLAAPSDLIDINKIDELQGITIDGNMISIGAACKHKEVATCKDLMTICPSLCKLAANIGDAHVRNMGTLGGSIANNDPAADYPAALMALNANIVTNQRVINVEDFFIDLFETALEEDEIIQSVIFEKPLKSGYGKFPNPASKYAMAGVFVAKMYDGNVRVAITGAGDDGVFRHSEMEKSLAKDFKTTSIENIKIDESSLLFDIHANQKYRANLVLIMAKRAVEIALQ